ncbi:uncharacterized protein LOC107879187 [Capsicum annuum]|uniref:uncharacterized protein LOC107879187 n=1 Tax=Capsicum annuum TaxID=4072 RepID=UPI0007BF0BB3|nr:uncharacterized protein LOC107879187 [Capsicum annuum]
MGVIRNGREDWVVGFSKRFTHENNNLIEFLVLKEGLNLALDQNLKPLDICIDSMEVINMLHHGNSLYNLNIFECKSLLESLGNPPVYHTYREKNRVADWMAKQDSKLDLFDKLHIFATPPASVGVVFREDFKGKSFSRVVSNNGNTYPNSYVFVPD